MKRIKLNLDKKALKKEQETQRQTVKLIDEFLASKQAKKGGTR